jgi:hypothetical protein
MGLFWQREMLRWWREDTVRAVAMASEGVQTSGVRIWRELSRWFQKVFRLAV